MELPQRLAEGVDAAGMVHAIEGVGRAVVGPQRRPGQGEDGIVGARSLPDDIAHHRAVPGLADDAATLLAAAATAALFAQLELLASPTRLVGLRRVGAPPPDAALLGVTLVRGRPPTEGESGAGPQDW